MEKTRISYEATRQLGDSIQKEATVYQDIYAQQIYTTSKNMLQNCFQGDDATTAMEQLDGLRNDFDAMRDVIMQYGKQLVKAAQDYEEDMSASKVAASNLTANRK